MARATWLAAVLRKAGCRVVELDGWQTRETRPGFEPEAVIWHHTATGPNVSNTNVRRLLRDGRSDLPGPLSQLGLERNGTFVVIAAGRCNHNGYGLHGNDAIGIEAYNSGLGEPWPSPQLDAYHVGTAAICRALAIPASRVLGHKESDPTRKIDPAGIDMDQARARVAALLAPAAPQEDDDVFIMKPLPGHSFRTRFMAPPLGFPIGSATEKAHVAEGVKVLRFTNDEAQDALRQIDQALTDEDVVIAIKANP